MERGHDRTYRAFERTARMLRTTDPEQGELTDDTLLEKLRGVRLLDHEGRAPHISLGTTPDIELPSRIRDRIAELIGPRGYRDEGITALPIERPLTEAEFSDTKQYFKLSYERVGIIDLDRVERIFPEHRFYHSQSGLTYAIQREFGWLSSEDLAFVATELCRIPDFLEIDPGFFVGTDPAWVAGYGIPPSGSRPNDLFSILQIPLDDPEVRRLMRTSVILEVDVATYRKQLPSTDCFVVRQTEINHTAPVFEVIAPVAPMERKIRAVFDWNNRG